MYSISLRDGSSLHGDGITRTFTGEISGVGSGSDRAALGAEKRILDNILPI
ncbi:hypothetical protein DPMN_191670 [Dreissena polymorpha]|uniref:Uncharacterized protein n=1 Tax=Dreissena polymorpha TaxID=45954 RepID=A0A9D3XYQ3_DREPO|nr:hypothetical protein DPMN_191670 [Dreissena polymorpha]